MKLRLAQGLVNLYQQKISRDYNAENGTHCLYTPSCSAYMKQAVQQEGLVDGVLDGLVRLSRCQKPVAEARLQEFLAPMLSLDPAEIGKLARFETPEAEQRIRRIRSLVDQNRAAIAAGNLAEAASLQQTWTQSLRQDVKILVLDQPGADHNAPTR
ncbi:MAG: membrane protein insertion efficiency factor YidD, partial [Vulcanimicrobiota bacterium]